VAPPLPLDVLLPEPLEELPGDPLPLEVDDPALPEPLLDDEPDPELLVGPASEPAPELEPPSPEPPSSPAPPHALPTARTKGNHPGNRMSRPPSNDPILDTPVARSATSALRSFRGGGASGDKL
jgi:hypothetical protein